jgi:hypothetical protein
LRFDLWKAKQIADAALTRGFINAENWDGATPDRITHTHIFYTDERLKRIRMKADRNRGLRPPPPPTGEHTMTLSDILGALAIFAIPLAMLAL